MLQFFRCRNDDALSVARTAIGQLSNHLSAQLITMACHAMSGRLRKHENLRALNATETRPTNSEMKDRTPFRRAKISKDWRKPAGSRVMPE